MDCCGKKEAAMEIDRVRTGYAYTGSARRGSAGAKEAGAGSFAGRMKDAAGREENLSQEKLPKEENSLKTTEEMMRFIRERKQEIVEKVRKGETEVKIPIGAQEYTQKEWNKLMESFDETEDDIREKLREARTESYKKNHQEVTESANI